MTPLSSIIFSLKGKAEPWLWRRMAAVLANTKKEKQAQNRWKVDAAAAAAQGFMLARASGRGTRT